MTIPDILALDFDGVLCDGMREYFETSRRTYTRTWPDEPAPADGLFPSFRALRPVIMSGWEMPLLLRAIVEARPESAIVQDWGVVRDELVRSLPGEELIQTLTRTLDEVRREWIAADPETQRWWKETNPCQVPIEKRGEGEWWAKMERVFFHS